MAYDEDQKKQIQEAFLNLEGEYEAIFLKFWALNVKPEAQEYVVHGFMRRLGTLKRAIQKVFEVYPIERTDKPNKEELADLAINLQAFLINVFGCFDNLAWVWVKEKELKGKKEAPLSGVKVGMISEKTHEFVRSTFSQSFQDYLTGLEKWFSYLEDYRHALAHRIPLYVVPFRVTPDEANIFQEFEQQKDTAIKKHNFEEFEKLDAQQQALGRFDPIAVHSISAQNNSIAFHPQMIADWHTVLEVAKNFLKELA